MGMWDGLKAKEIGDGVPTPDQYTNGKWQAQSALYQEMWEYYNLDKFDETLNQKENVKKFPLGINLFETACVTHRACLYGEYGDDVLQFRVAQPKAQNKDVEKVEHAIERMWIESGRNSLLLEAGLIGEILGGMVMRIWWHPVRRRVYFRLLQPDAWFPVWADDDYHEILECWVSYMIDAATALRRYHIKVDDNRHATVQVWEHWTKDFFQVLVDGKPAFWDRAHNFPMHGENVYKDPTTGEGVIPFEYFPRDRAGSFYGVPLGKNLLRLQNEYNLRAADLGDATMESAHKYLFLRNARKSPKLERGKLINLGQTAPGQTDPDVLDVSGGDIPDAAVAWAQQIKAEARTSVFTPPVSYGEDEGSQRSALTLAFRMWPLTQSVRTTRGFWGDSFYWLHRKAIIVAASHEKNGYNLELRHVDYRLLPTWAPMLPRDRAEEVNEVVTRKQTGLISMETAVSKLEEKGTEWVGEEIERIKKDLQEESDRQKELAEASSMGGSPNRPQQQQSAIKSPPAKMSDS